MSTLPSIATTLPGLRAGDWLGRGQTRRLLMAAVAALAFALVFVALWWAVVRWMDKRGWHVKV